jgi:hypothetical protein
VTNPQPTASESRLLAAVDDPAATEESVLALIAQLPSGSGFVLAEAWKERARDRSLADWRRLAAYRIMVGKVIVYPCEKQRFVAQAIVSVGVPEEQIIDLTRVGALPFERQEGDRVQMANLPIRTSVGPAGVYFAVGRDGRHVRIAKVYPESVSRNP